MSEQQDIRSRNEVQFSQIAHRVLEQAGFTAYVPEKKLFQPRIPQELLKKDGHIYCLETVHSRREIYASRAILNTAEDLIRQAKKWGYIPLIVVGGTLIPELRAGLMGMSIRTVILDIENLLYMARGNRDLYSEMVAQLSYSVSDLIPREPDYLPMPDWNATVDGFNNWRNDTIAPLPAPSASTGKNVWPEEKNTESGSEQLLENLGNGKASGTSCQETVISQESASDYLDKNSIEVSSDDQDNGNYTGLPMEAASGSMNRWCSEPLRLTFKSTGETKEYNETVVKVGRDSANDYSLAGITTVSRHHATFVYEYQMWVLIDNNSVNGTYLNGQRLVPGEKYRLTSNDEISFAKQDAVIFDKQMNTEKPEGESAARETDGQEPQQDINDPFISGRFGNGKSSFLTRIVFEKLQKDIKNWKGGKETNATAYEKLCTQTLMRLFGDDLTLWKAQAKSNSDLFRFDLICKIKRDNHRDFWEMAERYFGSKYIIFEFKNYAKQVTQKEVYTTVRYLYTKAMRGVAIIISPNGMDENAGKAIRGVLRDEGKLILSLTNMDLVHMLQMKENGEDPVDYLSDKLDELLIDLEK